ncbi:MAG: hypothetical protein ABIS17_00590 [Casimicrobiaceae bacterium]
MTTPAIPDATTKDIATLERLAKLLAAVTEDARQLVNSPSSGDQLKARVHLACALSAKLATSLSAASRDARRVRQAVELANEAIARAKARL